MIGSEEMRRTKKAKARKTREYGRHSEGWKVWNGYHPDDPILPDTGYVIHHKDHDHFNNSPDNLQKMTAFAHISHHSQGRNHSEAARQKMSEAHLGHITSEKTRRKLSIAQLGNKHSEETRRKMSASLMGRKPGFVGKKHSDQARQKMSEAHKRRNRRSS